MVRETWVQSQVASYQRLQQWYLIPPCLTLSILMYVSRLKWSNPGKEVAPYRVHITVVAIIKGAFGSPLTKVANFTYLFHSQYSALYESEEILIKHWPKLTSSWSITKNRKLKRILGAVFHEFWKKLATKQQL